MTDDYGVGHVYADDLYALAYGQGYVPARDRLFQMDLLRHIEYGDGATVIGPSQLASDVQVRRDLYTREELHDQLTPYEEFRYKPFPVDRAEVEDRAVRSETVRAEPAGPLPRLRGLLGL